MKKMSAIVGVLMLVAAAGAQGAIYDYTAGGLNGSDWTLEGWDADGAFSSHFNAGISMDGTSVNFTPNTPEGDYLRVSARGAMTWTVLQPGEYIESVTFSYWGSGLSNYFRARAYEMGAKEKLSDSTATAWDGPTGVAWVDESATLTFTTDDNVQKIGLGFYHTDSWCDWNVGVKNVTITTAVVPEPATLALMGAGLVSLIRRRK